MFNETWADQYARLLRSHRRLQGALGKRSEPADSDYLELDALYHFCSDALNLRDWIKEDLPQHGQDAATLIRSSPALSACADIANGSKHLRLTQTIYTPGGPAKVAGQGVVISPATAWTSISGAPRPPELPTEGTTQITFTIDAGTHGKYDALDLAAQAVQDWENWLRGRTLL